MDILLVDGSAPGCDRSLAAFFDPFLDLAETGVEAYGLGACWTACYPYPDRMNPIRQSLGLPATVVPYAVVPVGVPAGETQPKDKWDQSRIHYNRW